MSAIMDVDIEVDDLFGDGVGLTLPARPPSKQLLQRLDDLRRTGCCQGIAWSATGTLASISSDARSVELRFLRAHPDNAVWGLSEPTIFTPWADLPNGCSIVHVAWSNAHAPELFIIDSFGRVMIARLHACLNRPSVSRKWDSDPMDDLHAVVGCYALPSTPINKHRVVPSYGPAVKKGASFAPITGTFIQASGPFPPFQTNGALVCIATNGMLKLYWAQPNNGRIEETVLELESITSADDLVTHAAICSDRNSLLIALATASKQLRILRVSIQFSAAPQADKQPGHQILQVNMVEKHIAATTWLQADSPDSHLDGSMAQLSHLHIVPTVPEVGSKTNANPVVMTVRSYVPGVGTTYSQETQTIIDRWEIIMDQTQSLHSSFDQLGSRKASVSSGPQPTFRLKKLDPVVFNNRVIVGITPLNFARHICFSFSDGGVQYRDSYTFAELFQEPSLDNVLYLNDIGFTFTEDTPCLQVAFSPARTSFAQICEDGKVKWNCLQYSHGDIGTNMADPVYAAVVMAMALCFVSTTLNMQQTHDDIFAVARQFIDKEAFPRHLAFEVVRGLRVAVDYSEDAHHDKLVGEPSLPIVFRILSHMGFRGYYQPRSFNNKLTTITLNARLIIVMITVSNNAYQQHVLPGITPLDDPDVVDALVGCTEWARDLLSWIVDSLFNLLDDHNFMALLTQNFKEMDKYLRAKNEVVLHLCLCSSTREFLAALCRRLEHLHGVSFKAASHFERNGQPGPLKESYKRMASILSGSLVKWNDFEKLLQNLGQDIQSSYKAQFSNLTQPTGSQQQADDAAKRARTQIETTLLFGGSPPIWWKDIVFKFFKTHLEAFKKNTNQAELYFADYTLLEVADDSKMLATRRSRGEYIDTFRRVKLLGTKREAVNGPQWRRCTRCAAVMVEPTHTRTSVAYILNQLRKCPCGGSWAILPKDSMVA